MIPEADEAPDLPAAAFVVPPDLPELEYTAAWLPGPRLFFSDNPETIRDFPAGETGMVLWDHFMEGAGTTAVRVFFWHVNATKAPLLVGFTLENRGQDSLLVRRDEAVRVWEGSFSRGNYFAAGQDIAKVMLAGAARPFLPNDLHFPPAVLSSGPIPIDAARLRPGDHLFACYDILVRHPDGGRVDCLLRSAADTVDLGRQQGVPPRAEPVDAGDLYGHARGTWRGSRVEIRMAEPFVIQPGECGAQMRFAQRLSEAQATADAELCRLDGCLPGTAPLTGDYVKANKGMYGVDYEVAVQALNADSVPRRLEVHAGTRGGGRAMGCAVGLVGAIDAGQGVFGFPNQRGGERYLSAPRRAAVYVGGVELQPGATGECRFRAHIGGASTLPWFVFLASPAVERPRPE